MATMPRYVVFKSEQNSKYLIYRKDKCFNLGFSGDSVLSPESKFAIEVTTIGKGLVHVRSCYNNKYLVRGKSISGYIVAGAAQPEEDTGKDTCTLFAPLLVHNRNNNNIQTIRLRHVQTGKFVDAYHSFSSLSDSAGSIMEVINWDSLVIFPKHGRVAFKGSNGRYLGVTNNADLASYTVYPASNGNVQVYSRYFKKYWRVDQGGWIWADKHFGYPADPESLFTPIKIGSTTISFRSVFNNKFLRIVEMNGNRPCLNADATTISDLTHIRVEEQVISRKIYNIVYRQEDGRIYDETPIVGGTSSATATNNSNQEDTMAKLIEHTKTESTSWENSISLPLGISTTIKVGVPFIADGKINFNANLTGGHKWGRKKDDSLKMSTTYTAVIGAKTQVKVIGVASKGTCDVPFSYTQEDLFTDGTSEITDHDDGMFTGINCYNYSFNKQEDPL